MGDLGFFGCPIPEEYGGSNFGFLAYTVVTEEISAASGSLRVPFNMQTMGTAREILQFGTEEQRKKYIHKLVSAEYSGPTAIRPNMRLNGCSVARNCTRSSKDRQTSTSRSWLSTRWVTKKQTGEGCHKRRHIFLETCRS